MRATTANVSLLTEPAGNKSAHRTIPTELQCATAVQASMVMNAIWHTSHRQLTRLSCAFGRLTAGMEETMQLSMEIPWTFQSGVKTVMADPGCPPSLQGSAWLQSPPATFALGMQDPILAAGLQLRPSQFAPAG